jgi:hypothetical protein
VSKVSRNVSEKDIFVFWQSFVTQFNARDDPQILIALMRDVRVVDSKNRDETISPSCFPESSIHFLLEL